MANPNIGKGFHKIEEDLEVVHFRDLKAEMPTFMGEIVLGAIDDFEAVLPRYAAFEAFYQNREATKARQETLAPQLGNVVSLATKKSSSQDWLSAA